MINYNNELIHHLLFVFFKQKTAYELRISDWSSDVCSSDLKLTYFSAPQKHYRAQLQITLNHAIDAASAKQMLVTATKRSTLILSEPAPDARILSYNTEGIVYAVRYWVPSFANEVDCRDSALSEIDAALRAAMVPPPQRALQLV